MRTPTDSGLERAQRASKGDATRVEKPIRRVPQEELPGLEPLLFRELDHRIAQTRLQREPLPDVFLMCEDEQGGSLVFGGKRYDLNLTLFRDDDASRGAGSGDGVFVISNGAGAATNTVDQLSSSLRIAGMIDLKQDFSEAKISAALEMVRTVRPHLDALVINMISGMARARDAAAAVEGFCRSVSDAVPVILRFTAPDFGENQTVLGELAQRHPTVTLAGSTYDLVNKTVALFGVERVTSSARLSAAQQVDIALHTRARLGVTVDPRQWLTPDRTLGRIFGSKRETRVGALGFGKTARYQIGTMVEQGVQVCWVVTPSAAKHADPGIEGISVFPTVAEAIAARGDVDVVVNYAPAARTLDAILDWVAGASRARLMLVVAENLAYERALRVMDTLDASGTICIGPNSPGVALVDGDGRRADLFKLGNMPAFLFQRSGGMSVVGRSGTVIFDIVERAAAAGIGTRLAWAIGGDRYTGFGFLEALVMLEQDPHTRVIVINGESGGIQEQLAARLVATGVISKPVVALVTGEALPVGVQYGHQGSIKFAEADDPRVKKRHLAAAGVIVVDTPTEVAAAIRQIERVGWDLSARRRDALWEQLVAAGKVSGFRWSEAFRDSYELLYELVGHHAIFAAQETTRDHLHEVVTHLAAIGSERFRELLEGVIRPAAFIRAFEKSCEYAAELARGIHEIGIENFERLVASVFSEESFNRALQTTPWAAADLINEAHEVGIPETQTVVAKTMGGRLFRDTLARQPWNTAHAFRSINNMRWWRYVRAYDRFCTDLAGDNQLLRSAWKANPWASVKLVRAYDRMPDGELERALEDPPCWTVFQDRSRSDPQGLLDLVTGASREARAAGRLFQHVLRDKVREGVPRPPEVDAEIVRMGEEDFHELVDSVFTREAFERSRADHANSTARALRVINELGDAEGSGARKILTTYRQNHEVFDTPAFRLAVARNLWMLVDLLCATRRLDSVSVRRIVDYVLSPLAFNYSVAEHQWGTSQAFHKIADMGPADFLDTHRIMEDVTHDRESFTAGFKKNPRDVVQLVQVVALLGREDFARLMDDPETREAFLTRVRVCPRNAAHLLQEVSEMGVAAFETLVDRDLGRDFLNLMLRFNGCNLVHGMLRVNAVGVEDFRRELRAWRNEDPTHVLTTENAIEIFGAIMERALERRFADPERRLRVELHGQPTYWVSEGEIRGLYRSYPEWGEILFKLEAGEPITPTERVDLYRLVSGRKRFQSHMVPIVSNFLPLREIRSRITAGEPLIREIRALRGVSQRPPHRFDAYFHTLEVLEQLANHVLPLDFVPEAVRRRVRKELKQEIDHVSRQHLLMLAGALHDLGKIYGQTDEIGGHVERGIAAARPILERFGMTDDQKALVIAVIRHHAPPKLRKHGEPWEDFEKRGGLELLYREIAGHGENPYPLETALHYHADILGKRGSETPPAEVERRKRVTRFLLERYVRERPAPGETSPPADRATGMQ